MTGLLVAYRSGSSSDRWHEGRRLWASVTSTSRSLLRHLSLTLIPLATSTKTLTQETEIIRNVFALISVLPLALKFHLRDQNAFDHPSFQQLLPSPLFRTLNNAANSFGTLPSHEKPSEPTETERGLALLNDQSGKMHRGEPKVNVPLLLIRSLHALLNHLAASKTLDSSVHGRALGSLDSLTETLTQMERIRDTPIPMILGIHLQQIIVLYLAAIPPPLVKVLGFCRTLLLCASKWTSQ